MEAPIIEKASVSDIRILNEISLESKKYWNYPKEWIELWKEDLKLSLEDFKNQSVYKIRLGKVIFGFCAIQKNEGNFEINHLWILPDFIGKGYGKLLLNQSLEKVVKFDSEVIVTADPHAEPFYKSQGFITFDRYESSPKGRYLPIMKMNFSKNKK